MNAPAKFQRIAALFKSNRSQAVRIPKDLAFPESVKKVRVRKIGDDLVLSPVVSSWSEFFALGPNPDFPERAPQGKYEEREEF
jgi:antitoxin VapB